MAYTTYDFYMNKFGGSTIQEQEFEKWERRAEIVINRHTFQRLRTNYPEDEYSDEMIQMAICAIAEDIYEIEKYQKALTISESGENIGLIKSRTAGSESVTYATGESWHEDVVKDSGKLEQRYKAKIFSYLSEVTDSTGECLLYAGMR